MRVKAKFIVDHVTKFQGDVERVTLTAGDEGATQKLEIYISNKDVHGHFVPGEAHYITFEKAV